MKRGGIGNTRLYFLGIVLGPYYGYMNPVVTFTWKSDFSEKACLMAQENNLLWSYTKDEPSARDIACSRTQEEFVAKLKKYNHPFLAAGFMEPELFEALLVHYACDQYFLNVPLVALFIMKAFEMKADEFIYYLDTKMTDVEYLGFEAALLLHDAELEKASLQKGVKLDEAFYNEDGPTLMDLVRKKKCSYMRERVLRITESSINKKRNDLVPLSVITERLRKILKESKKGCNYAQPFGNY